MMTEWVPPDNDDMKLAIELIAKIQEKPDVPSGEIYSLLNTLSSLEARFRVQSVLVKVNGDLKTAALYKEMAISLSAIIGTLKYQAKSYQEKFN